MDISLKKVQVVACGLTGLTGSYTHICNRDDYIKVAREELVKQLDASETNETTTKEKVNRKELTVFQCDITDTYGILHKNQTVKVAPFSEEVSLFFLCAGCGKLYWEGSHLKRYKKCLSDVIEKKTGNFLNYSLKEKEIVPPKAGHQNYGKGVLSRVICAAESCYTTSYVSLWHAYLAWLIDFYWIFKNEFNERYRPGDPED